jgi:hypothetical protein
MLSESVRKNIFNFLLDKISDLRISDMYNQIDEFQDECEEHWEEVGDLCHADDIRHGASKIVLFYDEYPDWVIKVPIFGDYLEEDRSYHDYTSANLYEDGAHILQSNDYCNTETLVAKYAVQSELQDLFALTYFVGFIHGIPFYCSERIEETLCESGYIFPSNNEIVHSTEKIITQYPNIEDLMNEDILEHFVSQYGKERIAALVRFLIHLNIQDLHSANIGLDKDYQLKIIDYSNFSY